MDNNQKKRPKDRKERLLYILGYASSNKVRNKIRYC